VRLDEIIPGLEEVQSMSMPSQDLAAIHAFAHKPCQGIANCEIYPLNVCGIDLSTGIDPKQSHYLSRVAINDTLYHLYELPILSFLADHCVLQARVGDENRIWLSPDTAIGWCLKEAIDVKKSFFKGVPVIGCEYRNR
jgi:hypothetical protein